MYLIIWKLDLITYLSWTCKFEWCMVSCGYESNDLKYTYLKKIGLHNQHLLVKLVLVYVWNGHFFFNPPCGNLKVQWGCPYMDIFKVILNRRDAHFQITCKIRPWFTQVATLKSFPSLWFIIMPHTTFCSSLNTCEWTLHWWGIDEIQKDDVNYTKYHI